MLNLNQRERNYFNERATLGSVILNPNAFSEIAQVVGTGTDMFEEPTHKQIWRAMVQLSSERRPIDYVTLSDICRDISASELSTLDDAVPQSSRVTFYAELVRDAFVARKMYAHALKIKRLYEQDSLSHEAMSEESGAISGLFSQKQSGSMQLVSDIIPQVIEEIEQGLRNPNAIKSIRIGIPELDKMLDCLRPDTLNIIGARPSVGKSALAANMAINAARAGHPVLFFSLEMGSRSIVKRLMSIDQCVPYKTLAGVFSENLQKERLNKAVANFAKMRLTINCPGSLDIHQFRADSKRFASQSEGMPLIILDYLQLARMDSGKKNANRYEQIGEFTREAKLLAGELHCPVVLLCQLSRQADLTDDPSSCMPYMRESGNIENDADTVLVMLKRLDDGLKSVVDSSVQEGLRGNVVNCGVIKNRDFETGPCTLYFDKPTQRIISFADFLGGELGRSYEHSDDASVNPFPEYDYEEDDTPF